MSLDLSNLTSVIVAAEDPGALNFIIPLLDSLAENTVPVHLLSFGYAHNHLSQIGYPTIALTGDEDPERALTRYNCNFLIVGTSENRNTPVLRLVSAARRLKVASVGIVDAVVNYQYRFCGPRTEPLAYAPDWLFVPDGPTAEAFVSIGFHRSRICIIGNPARDLAKQRSIILQSRASDRLISRESKSYKVVFVSELSDGLNKDQYTKSDEYTLFGRGISADRTSIVAEELLDARTMLASSYAIDINLLLRLHPKQAHSDLGSLCDEFDEISFGGDPLEVIAPADLVVGMTSMLLVQAFDMGLQCLSILPRAQEKMWVPELKMDKIHSVVDRSTLRSFLVSYFLSEPRRYQSPPRLNLGANPIDLMIKSIHGITSINKLI